MLWINATSVPSAAAERCALPWASIPYTIERTQALGTGIPWTPRHIYIATSAVQSWVETTGAWSRAFYRVRSGPP